MKLAERVEFIHLRSDIRRMEQDEFAACEVEASFQALPARFTAEQPFDFYPFLVLVVAATPPDEGYSSFLSEIDPLDRVEECFVTEEESDSGPDFQKRCSVIRPTCPCIVGAEREILAGGFSLGSHP